MTESMILENYDLGGVDCPYCRNSGMVTRVGEDGALYSRECRCMKKRIALRRIRRSGMSDLLRRYRFDSYIAETPEQERSCGWRGVLRRRTAGGFTSSVRAAPARATSAPPSAGR